MQKEAPFYLPAGDEISLFESALRQYGLSARAFDRDLPNRRFMEILRRHHVAGLDLLPADFSYRNIDIALDDMKKSRQRISRILKPLRTEYDRIFIDCPPNITLLSENIFYAADNILVPLVPTTLSHLALQQLFRFLEEIGEKRSKVMVFFSMVEKRKKMHWQLMRQLIKMKNVLPALVPYLADVEKMGLYREPVNVTAPTSMAAAAYNDLWKVVRKRMKKG